MFHGNQSSFVRVVFNLTTVSTHGFDKIKRRDLRITEKSRIKDSKRVLVWTESFSVGLSINKWFPTLKEVTR